MKKITTKLTAVLGAVMLFTNVSAQGDKEAQKAQQDKWQKAQKEEQERNIREQNDPVMRKKWMDDLMKNTTYIFEGKVVPSSGKNFTTSDGANYSTVLIEVQEVIKGSLKKGTVEIIKFTSKTDKDGNISYMHCDDCYEPTAPQGTALFFCADDKNVPNTSGVTKTNSTPIAIIDVVPSTNNIIPKQSPRSELKFFKTMDELYTYLSSNYSIKIDKALLEKKSLSTTQQQINNIPYEQKVKNYNNYMQHIQAKLQQRKKSPNSVSSTGCQELYISEYLCTAGGTGNDKSLEVYNPTNAAINLANYSLLIYHGGSYTPTTIALTGTIAAQSTHVISKPNANADILAHTNQTDNNLNFNGDECIVLNKAAIHIDKIGEIGIAVGSGGFTLTPSGSTTNSDLRRKYNIGRGDTAWTNCKSEWDVFSSDSTNNLGIHANICATDPDLDINFANPYSVDSSNGKQYFEFDIMASSIGADTYLDNSPVWIKYNSTAFGTNIVANGKVTFVRGAGFNTTTYLDPNSNDFDHSPDTLVVGFGTDVTQSSWSRVLITSTPIQLMRVFIQVQTCNQSSNLQFVNTFGTSLSTSYVAGQYDNPITATSYFYTNVNYGTDLNYTIPCVQITDFTQPIDAGIGDILTITGMGFGASQGTGQVKFKNADDGGATYISKLNTIDYISWTDTQIQIRLPDFADSILQHPDESNRFTLGGGNFVVINNAGQTDTSILNSSYLPFYIYYNINQGWSSNKDKKLEVDLRNDNGSGGYTLRLNPTDFPVGSVQRGIFTKAMHDWTCMTGMNWKIGVDTSFPYNANVSDNVNYISFTTLTSTLSPSTNAQTKSWFTSCSGDIAVVLTEADIQFNSTRTWFYDSTGTLAVPSGQEDFYGVALHELGHFIQLAHHTDPTNLMYYAGNTGPIIAGNRKTLTISTSPAEGGLYSVGQSASNTATCLGLAVMITENSTGCTAGINTYLKNNYFFTLYPNPSDGSNVNIDFKAPTNTDAQIVVYDMMGRAVYSNSLNNRNEINSAYSLDVSNLASGVYMVNLVIDKVKVCQKLIKN